jgi:hypothetical protein
MIPVNRAIGGRHVAGPSDRLIVAGSPADKSYR